MGMDRWTGYLGFDQPDHVGCQWGSIRWSDDRCSSNANWELTMQLMRVQSSLQVAEIFWLQKNNKNDGLKPTSGCLIRQFCLQKNRDFTISHRDWRHSSESTTKCYNPNNIFMAIYILPAKTLQWWEWWTSNQVCANWGSLIDLIAWTGFVQMQHLPFGPPKYASVC